MTRLYAWTLSTLLLGLSCLLPAQAQILLDGRIQASEIGTAAGRYQSIGQFTLPRGFGDWGVVEAWAASDATNLYIAVQGTVESNGNSFQIYLNTPNAIGHAAGVALPAAPSLTGDPTSFAAMTGTLDMESDLALAWRYNAGIPQVEFVDYTLPSPSSQVLGTTNDVGTATTFLGGAIASAYRTSPTGTILTNTNEGLELRIPLSALGLLAGQTIQLFVLQNNGDGGYASSDFIPQGPVPATAGGAPSNMGPSPDFTTVTGLQYANHVIGSAVTPSAYCTTGLGGGNCDITQVSLAGTTLNTTLSLCPTGSADFYSSYPASGSTTGTVTRGQSYQLTVATSQADIISAWADWNQNQVFDASEWVQVTFSGTGGTVALAVPATATLGQTVLRIRSRLTGNSNTSTDACSNFGSGEARDYTLTVQAGSTSAYCITGLGGGSCDITQVSLAGTTLNTTVSNCPTGSADFYSSYPASGSTTGTVSRGQSYQLTVATSGTDIISAWADWNHNNLFDASEWVQVTFSGTSGTVALAVPAAAVLGQTTLRIRSRVSGTSNGSTDACSNFGSGETRDYTLTVQAGSTSAYCTTGLGGGSCDITQVSLAGTTLNTTLSLCPGGNPDYYSSYPASGSTTGTVSRGQSYSLTVATSGLDIISAWADWNHNNLFDASEWVQVTFSGTSGTVALAVPAAAVLGQTVLRIRSRSSGNSNGSTDACSNFGSGETRDYTLTVQAGSTNVYCTTNLGGGSCDITQVTLAGTTLNTTLSNCPTGSVDFYSSYPASGSTTGTVTRGQSYQLTVVTSGLDIISAWADWNHNNLFDASEWVQVTFSGTSGTVALAVPAAAVLGQTVLRIRSRSSGNSNGSTDACSNFGSGETRDYTLTVINSTGPPNTPPNWVWTRRVGGTTTDQTMATATDAAGNVYVTGRFQGTASLGTTTLTSAGGYDIVLAKYDGSGTLQWARRAGGTQNDNGWTLDTDNSGNVLVTGWFEGTATFGTLTLTSAGSGDIFLAKYDPQGTLLWARRAGGTGFDAAYAIDVDASGNAYLTGTFSSSATFGTTTLTSAGSDDMFLVKYDAAGTSLWARRGGGFSAEVSSGVAVIGTTGVYVTGSFTGTAPFGPIVLTSAGTNDVFLVKYDAAGNVNWARRGGSAAGASGGNDVGTDAAGNAYVTGYFLTNAAFDNQFITSTGGVDMFLVKYSTTGTALWARSAGGTSSTDSGYFLATDATGNSYVTGFFTDAAAFGTFLLSGSSAEGYVAKYDAAGTIQWVAQMGGPGSDLTYAPALDAAGNVYVPGEFNNTAAFGTTLSLTSAGGSDGFLAKLGTACTLATPTLSSNAPVCAGQTLTLTSSGLPTSGITYLWTGPNSFTSTQQNPTLPNATAAATGTYTLTATSAQLACSQSSTVQVTVSALPTAPTATGDSRCGPGTLTLTASGAPTGGAYRWYTVATGGTPISGQTGATYTTPSLTTTTTYYVTAVNGTCESPLPRTPAVATISAAPTATLTAGGSTTFCAGTSVTLTASGAGTGGTYQYLLNGQDINGATSATYTATQAGPYTVLVTNAAGCASTSPVVTLTVTPAPTAPATVPASRCGAGTLTLTASGAPAGGSYRWYTVASGGTAITGQTSASYTTPSLSATTTYYVTTRSAGGCESTPRTPVTATINTAPTATLTAGGPTTFCLGGSVVLTAAQAAAGATYQYLLNGAPIAGATARTYTVLQSGQYTVTVSSAAGCVATSAPVAVTVTTPPSATFAYATSTYCLSGANPTPAVTGAPGGTFTASPAGLTLSPTTGTITLASSAAGTYSVTYSVGGLCPASATQTLTLTTAPSAAFSYPTTTPACAGAGGSLVPTLGPGASAGTFTATPAGLVLTAGSGAVDLTASAPGTYTVTNAIAASGTCAASTATATLTLLAAPTASLAAGGPTTFCDGGAVTLTAGGSGTYQYLLNGAPITGATGPTYSATQAGTYVVTVTSAAGCIATSAPVQVAVTPQPTATFSYAAATFCQGGVNPAPTITGTPGGSFAATPAGLNLNPATGAIDLTTSASGTYTVTYSIAGPCPATQATTLTVTTTPLATFAYGVPSACAGGAPLTPTLATGALAGTFTATPGGVVIDPATGTVNAALSQPGTYVITNAVSASGGCPAVTATTTLTLTAAPVAALTGLPAAVCANAAPIVLAGTLNGQAAPTATFTVNGQAATTFDPTALVPGTYTVVMSATSTSGCVGQGSQTVTVRALPAAPSFSAQSQPGGIVVLTSSAPAGNQWYLNGQPITGATGQTYAVTTSAQNGSYSVSFTDPGTNCPSLPSAGLTVTVTGAGAPLATLGATLAPNPTPDGRVTLTLTGFGQGATLTVLDATGRLVARQALSGSPADQTKLILDGRAWPTGVYAVRVSGPAGTLVRRLVRE